MESHKYSFENSIGRLNREITVNLGHILKIRFTEKGHNIKPIEWVALGYIYHNEGLTQIRLSELLGHNKVRVKRIVDILEEKKYVKRKSIKSDKRFNSLMITPSGKLDFDQLSKIASEVLNQSLQDLSEEEILAYLEVSNKISTNIKSLL
ncbi:MAG: winged helix-turn-helix transcriptional regulator [Bacteroidales bacterium]|nr:winged helix-turn-helix transcriptional regulator [Bacteroidales bacterium]